MRFILILLLLNIVEVEVAYAAKRAKGKNRDANNDGFDDESGAWIPKVSRFDTPETRALVNNTTKTILSFILFCSISQCLRNSI
jgi:hypothetical protein